MLSTDGTMTSAVVYTTAEGRFDISVSLDGQPLALTTDYSYNQSSGQFDTVPGVITVPAAAYAQTASTGDWIVTPGEAVLTVTGTI